MLDFDNFGHRFALVLKSLKVTKHGIATKLDVSHTTISNIINHTNSPSIDKLAKILAMSPNLNLDWLITGRGKMYLNETPDGATFVEEPSQFYEVNAMTDLREEINYLKEQVATLRKLNQLYEEKISRLEATYKQEQQPTGKKNAL